MDRQCASTFRLPNVDIICLWQILDLANVWVFFSCHSIIYLWHILGLAFGLSFLVTLILIHIVVWPMSVAGVDGIYMSIFGPFGHS